MYKIVFSPLAVKDLEKINAYGLGKDVKDLMDLLRDNPFKTEPPYISLVGELTGACSRRINFHHRLVYHVEEAIKTIQILSLWNY